MKSASSEATNLIGQRVQLVGHFQEPVTVKGVRLLGSSVELQVTRGDGNLDETILSAAELDVLPAQVTNQPTETPLADPQQLRLLVESARPRPRCHPLRHRRPVRCGSR
jgi:hypothetical protein